jgi:hypothetical protein
MKVSEYDAFGPWIYEVSEEHPLPPLFVPFYKEDGNFLMRIKIPRNIERKNAKPGMDLYDYVIGLYEDHIYILKREDKQVEERSVYFDEINGIEALSRLLAGTLTIYLTDGKIEIPYNLVSNNVVMKLVGLIRNRYSKKTYEDNDPYCFDNNPAVETLFTNLLFKMKSEEDLRICAVQRSIPLKLNKANFFEQLKYFITPRKLFNTLHLSNSRELIILTRGKAFKEGRVPNYAYAITYLPFERLSGVLIENDEEYSGLAALHIKLPGQDFKFYFEQMNKESIHYYNNLGCCARLMNC